MFGHVIPRILEVFTTKEGRIPFKEWLADLKDKKTIVAIQIRLARLRRGNFGDYRPVGQGVFELKINYGPGYRIYFGLRSLQIVLLLCGGHKGTQQRDIEMAQKYWNEARSAR